jgi:hypothetical protein
MIGERLVAILAGIKKTATLHLDGDDVSRPAIMLATGLRIEVYATDVGRSQRHRFSLTRGQNSLDRQQFFVEAADLPCPIHKVNLKWCLNEGSAPPLPNGNVPFGTCWPTAGKR